MDTTENKIVNSLRNLTMQIEDLETKKREELGWKRGESYLRYVPIHNSNKRGCATMNCVYELRRVKVIFQLCAAMVLKTLIFLSKGSGSRTK